MSSVPFSQRLELLRERYGLTQQELAEKIGVSREQVSRWERGKQNPSVDKLSEICRALGIEESQFWDDSVASVKPKAINTARPMTAGPYLGVPTNEAHMALECPRCGATDFSAKARYCRQCAFPLYNYCMHPDMESRHINLPDAVYCEECARPTFWSKEYVTLEEILGERAMHSVHSAEGEQHRT